MRKVKDLGVPGGAQGEIWWGEKGVAGDGAGGERGFKRSGGGGASCLCGLCVLGGWRETVIFKRSSRGAEADGFT